MATAPVGNGTRLGPVHLAVTDLDRSVAVWRDVIGLGVISSSVETATLGVLQKPLIVLIGGATSPVRGPVVGLFHVAIEVPSALDLSRVAARMLRSGHKVVGLDHLTTDSLYVTDPDGLDIEVLLKTPTRGRIEITNGNPKAVPNDGSAHSGRDPRDVEKLASLASGDTSAPLGAGTHVDHIHLRSRDPQRLLEFYCGTLGLLPFINSPTIGMYDAGTEAFPHLMAFNSWGGPSIQDRATGMAGLACFEIAIENSEQPQLLEQKLKAQRQSGPDRVAESGYRDPDGNVFLVTSR